MKTWILSLLFFLFTAIALPAMNAHAAGWSAAASLTTARQYHSATPLPNGKVLVAGGIDSSGVLNSAEIYDPATNTWSSAGSLTTARYTHTATLLPNGKVLVAGGVGSSSYLNSAELYDSATNTWSTASSLTTARFTHSATLLPNGKLLVTSTPHQYLCKRMLYCQMMFRHRKG